MIPPQHSAPKSKPRGESPRKAQSVDLHEPSRGALKATARRLSGRAADLAGQTRLEVPATAAEAIETVAQHMPWQEKTITVKEAAFRLGKSPDAVYQWLRAGRLRGMQPGGRGCAILVVESSVSEALLCTFQRASAGRSGRANCHG